MAKEKQLELDLFQEPDMQYLLLDVLTDISDDLTGIRQILGAFLDVVKEERAK